MLLVLLVVPLPLVMVLMVLMVLMLLSLEFGFGLGLALGPRFGLGLGLLHKVWRRTRSPSAVGLDLPAFTQLLRQLQHVNERPAIPLAHQFSLIGFIWRQMPGNTRSLSLFLTGIPDRLAGRLLEPSRPAAARRGCDVRAGQRTAGLIFEMIVHVLIFNVFIFE